MSCHACKRRTKVPWAAWAAVGAAKGDLLSSVYSKSLLVRVWAMWVVPPPSVLSRLTAEERVRVIGACSI